jgi:hypothetical protein
MSSVSRCRIRLSPRSNNRLTTELSLPANSPWLARKGSVTLWNTWCCYWPFRIRGFVHSSSLGEMQRTPILARVSAARCCNLDSLPISYHTFFTIFPNEVSNCRLGRSDLPPCVHRRAMIRSPQSETTIAEHSSWQVPRYTEATRFRQSQNISVCWQQ